MVFKDIVDLNFIAFINSSFFLIIGDKHIFLEVGGCEVAYFHFRLSEPFDYLFGYIIYHLHC